MGRQHNGMPWRTAACYQYECIPFGLDCIHHFEPVHDQVCHRHPVHGRALHATGFHGDLDPGNLPVASLNN